MKPETKSQVRRKEAQNSSMNPTSEQYLASLEWKKELNKQFFYEIPIEEMGSNQVNEQELYDFIGHLLTQTAERYAELKMAEILAKINKIKREDHILQGKNITHEKEEMWCCMDCYNDQEKKENLSAVIELFKK